MRIRLSGADREKYHVPEWLTYDPSRIGLREAAVLKRATRWTPERLAERLHGVEVWEDGQLVMVPKLDETGAPVLENGQPAMEPKLEPDFEAIAVVIWLALRRAGSTVLWNDDFDIDAGGLEIADDEETEVGKAPGTTTTIS